MARPDPNEIGLRLAIAAGIGIGPVVAMYASLVADLAPPIPYRFIPDLRPVILFGVTFAIAGLAAFGPGRRRSFLVAYLLTIHAVFSFELSTIHWFIPYPGPIGGSRVDPLRAAALLSGLFGAILLQARVHAEATRADLVRRGVPAEESAAVGIALRSKGVQSAVVALAAIVVLGILVEVSAGVAGNEGAMSLGSAIALGAALLLALGLVVGLVARDRRSAPAQQDEH